MTTLVPLILICLTALPGSGIGAALSRVPGKRGHGLLRALPLLFAGPVLFFGGLCLAGRTADPLRLSAVFFPDAPSVLAGCGILLLICSLLGFLLGLFRAGGLRRYFRAVQGSRLHRGAGIALAAGGAAVVIGCGAMVRPPAPLPVRLSEVCCANFSLRTDPDRGEYSDYIELVNTGSEAVDLEGCFLSDSGKHRDRFRLPALRLEPGACAVVWADGTGRSGERAGEDVHLNFSLEPGETVWLSSPTGAVLDQVTVPERYKDVSLSRVEDRWVLAQGSPGFVNGAAAPFSAPTLEPPELSLASGFYDGPQKLKISAPRGCEIRYTLDGSVPTKDSLLYDGPLTLEDVSGRPNLVLNHPNTTADRSGVVTEPVDKGTVLRAAAFDGSGARSPTVTAVYFVGKDTFAKYEGMRVLSITADPEDLFGRYGIAVTGPEYDRWLEEGGEGEPPAPNYSRKGRMMERDAEITLWDAAHQPVLRQACGLRLQGGTSRARMIKRFRLISRKVYSGSYCFVAPIFDGIRSHSFFTRRDSADPIAQLLCSGLGLGGLGAERAALFVNGEFYCFCFLRECYDEQYFLGHFGVERGDLALVSNGEADIGTREDYEDYLDLMDYVTENDCSDPTVYASVCSRMDVRSYARYAAVNLYCNNTDCSVNKNCKLWRTRSSGGEGVHDGRWRWLVYDMDACFWKRPTFFGDAPRESYDLFGYPAPSIGAPFREMPVFRDLMRNGEFRILFAQSWLELMNVTHTPERAQALLDGFGITDDSFWVGFLTNRPAYAADILIRELELPGEACALRLSVSDPAGGRMYLDGLAAELPDGSREGIWVAGIPLTLRAEAAEGWRFVGWQGAVSGTDRTVVLTPEGDTAVTAVFEKIE